ncbi:hypothetical protein VTJ04DRAFT_10159 [Mycothermus thermophilus]|uniref:uncharacterized protein n=1 Tax=Humicola insolens TaxID=85995 RepID=UPI00374209F1
MYILVCVVTRVGGKRMGLVRLGSFVCFELRSRRLAGLAVGIQFLTLGGLGSIYRHKQRFGGETSQPQINVGQHN